MVETLLEKLYWCIKNIWQSLEFYFTLKKTFRIDESVGRIENHWWVPSHRSSIFRLAAGSVCRIAVLTRPYRKLGQNKASKWWKIFLGFNLIALYQSSMESLYNTSLLTQFNYNYKQKSIERKNAKLLDEASWKRKASRQNL